MAAAVTTSLGDISSEALRGGTRRVWARRGVATRYHWGYLHEALEVDGAHATQLLFTPAIDRDIHALFLKQIADTDQQSFHVVIADQAGFHLPEADPHIPGQHVIPISVN